MVSSGRVGEHTVLLGSQQPYASKLTNCETVTNKDLPTLYLNLCVSTTKGKVHQIQVDYNPWHRFGINI